MIEVSLDKEYYSSVILNNERMLKKHSFFNLYLRFKLYFNKGDEKNGRF